MNLTAKFLIASLCLLLSACGGNDDAHDHAHDDAHNEAGGHAHGAVETEPVKGPHGGRLLSDGDVTVEVAIFEAGVPPEFHVYVTRAGSPVEPQQVTLTIELSRLGGKVDRFEFTPENDYLKGSGTVTEPHSFDVNVVATVAGKTYQWQYPSYEGRTVIAPAMAEASGITTAVAAGGVLREMLTLHGTIRPDAEQVREISARFPGLIRRVDKQIGDAVRAGEALAVIESNESLQNYTVSSPIDGTVIARHANSGEVTNTEPLFVVANDSSVWAELTLFTRDRARIQRDQRVVVTSVDGKQQSEGTIAHVLPGTTTADSNAPSGGQTQIARVVLTNTNRQWTPGLFVNANVTTGESEVPLLVANSALQTFRDFTVVFAQVGDTYEVRMLELGRSDGEMTEVLGGLEAGTNYVTGNSYLIKADIEKSGASHDH